jgi:hypothetical protein
MGASASSPIEDMKDRIKGLLDRFYKNHSNDEMRNLLEELDADFEGYYMAMDEEEKKA